VADSEELRWRAQIVGTLTENPYFAVREQLVVRPDGAELTYYTIDFPGPAVGIVARRGDEFLLIRQYRFIVDEWVWAIASGGVSPGEQPEDAARRELEEETGYRATSLVPILDYYPSYGSGNQQYKLYLAVDPQPTGGAFDAAEVHDVRWFTKAELVEMIRANGVVDGLSLTPLLLVLLDDAARASGGERFINE